ncbi:MAG TPA: cell division protein SepF [Bacilli bacterium]|nr:cell division protein SepF [Bacilli bacterium]
MGLIKKFFNNDEENYSANTTSEEYYSIKTEDTLDESGKSRMILLEPRAYSESYQIIDHLKSRNPVVVNLKRVTATQAKRIMDVLNGAAYAIGGDIQKIGGGIFLCTPNNVNIQGKITDENDKKDAEKEEQDVEW